MPESTSMSSPVPAASDWRRTKAVQEVCDLSYRMWELGWTPGGGGNVSYLLDDAEVAELGYVPGSGRRIAMESIPDGVRGRYILVTATGSFFRELRDDPDHLLGIIHIPTSGDYYEICRGLEGSRPTGELDSHLAAHATRLAVDPTQRVVMHNHTPHVLEMTHVAPLDERDFTLDIWRMIPEAVLFLPEGIGLVPWCVPCTQDMATLTLDSMRTHRIVVWQYHGLFATGSSMHELFGLLELIDMCCETWMAAEACPSRHPGISDEGLRGICERFRVTPHEGYLA